MIIKQLEFEDLKERVKWMNDPFIYSTMNIKIPISYSRTKQWYESLHNRNRIDFTFWDIDERTRLAMGGLVDIDEMNNRAELYIFINPDKKGQNIGKKATKWICNFGFLKFNLNKIYLYTLQGNTSANHLYKNIGFVREGVMRKHQMQFSKMVDKNIYGILRDEWLNQEWAEKSIKFKLQ